MRRFIKSLICIASVLYSVDVNAQVSLLQSTIDKLESYKSFSYQSVNKQKELFTNDTITEHHNAVFVKGSENKNFGYLFNIETRNENDRSVCADLYNGQDVIHITPKDSTYQIQKIQTFNNQGTLPGCLKWIQDRLKKKSSKIEKTSDKTFNAIDSYHLIANVYDTIINKEHNYTYVDLYIDKLSGMPDCITVKSINTTFGDGVSHYYSETRYSDYKFNEVNINIASMTIPNGFHPPKERTALPDLLSIGSVAPNCTLSTADGKRMSLAQMKGKVVLLDFYFIGCGGCMEAIKPLNKLYEKYKKQNIVIASINERDNKQSVLALEKNYQIKYPGYINAADMIKSYHVKGFPTFYFIDKEGKIANVFVGYSDAFEGKVTSIIDNLLKK